jgi:hypothetical protein
MKYGYALVSTDGQSVDAQVRQLTKAGCKKVFREVAEAGGLLVQAILIASGTSSAASRTLRLRGIRSE